MKSVFQWCRDFYLILTLRVFSFIGISVADLSSEDLELTHMLCESLLVSDNQISPGGEEAALSACNRLHRTVDMLLELLNQANTQVNGLVVC